MKLGYARVSTNDQDLSMQLDALEAAGCDRVFQEKASGGKTSRPELDRMMDLAREGDVIVVRSLDRLGRSLSDLIKWMTMFNTRGIGFRSLQEGIDATTAAGRLFFHIFGSLAEFERELIRERTHAGLVAARARGRVGGRDRALNEVQIKMAQEMYARRDMTVAEIANALGVSRSTVYRALPAPAQLVVPSTASSPSVDPRERTG